MRPCVRATVRRDPGRRTVHITTSRLTYACTISIFTSAVFEQGDTDPTAFASKCSWPGMVRLKSRYLTVCVETGDEECFPCSHQLLEALKASVAENFGVFGTARVESSLHVHHLEAGSNMFCVRCPRAARMMVHAAITFITEFGEGVPVVCSVLAARGCSLPFFL